ncbi:MULTISPECIES: T9SS type A sorting domain-containing protein [unclassified Polaribacter]|uniref:T9SS type A sorting domain-containing protein n=1 Tax=unclassified Polaribacter TaxID=196858 RepID=UPI0011BE69A3|nr:MULTISPECIES: T9SS type A sorting domain-containing protein [unclassified Polaribacter]TXD54341.1 T9SS type A sorting domain-containing protein [Polaribacter sp. IC063]TXD62828.1 T9SS type A sorting domain-containing protein [Polaribacter sp. IC066]
MVKFIGIFCCIIFTFSPFLGQSQIKDFKEKFELPSAVKETSGLLMINGKIITHNDKGDAANLYEIDSLTGKLLRTIQITNATNEDWEDLAEDEEHIYIGDFGNNNGNRTNLRIYKILKSDFKNSTAVTAKRISFGYEDQINFSNQTNNHNFDAEALVVYNNDLLIFTKNRKDFKTNVYKIPKESGGYSAKKISSANVRGLITGATYNKEDNSFFLCGYSSNTIPFLIYINENRAAGDAIFSDGFLKISLQNELGQGSQIEGITNFNGGGNYYLSREFSNDTTGDNQSRFQQKLFQFYDESNPILSAIENTFTDISMYPNPTKNTITIDTTAPLKAISIINQIGKEVFKSTANEHQIDISYLTKGIYFIRVEINATKSFFKKIVKI